MHLIGSYIKYNVWVHLRRDFAHQCSCATGATTDFRRQIFTSDGSHNYCTSIRVNLKQQSDISCDRWSQRSRLYTAHVVLLLFRVINEICFAFIYDFAASFHFSIFIIAKDKYSVYFEKHAENIHVYKNNSKMKIPVPLFSSPAKGWGSSYDHGCIPYCDLHEPIYNWYL